jgi:hypothetical protein
MSEIKESKGKCLVHDTDGKGVAPAMIMSYMLKSSASSGKYLALAKARDYVQGKYHGVNPNDNFMRQLVKLEKKLFQDASVHIKPSGNFKRGGKGHKGKGRRGK